MGSKARREAKQQAQRADMLAFISRQLDHLEEGQRIIICKHKGATLIGRDYASPPPPINQGAV